MWVCARLFLCSSKVLATIHWACAAFCFLFVFLFFKEVLVPSLYFLFVSGPEEEWTISGPPTPDTGMIVQVARQIVEEG